MPAIAWLNPAVADRALFWLTLLSALLLPVVLSLWVRSYVHNDTWHRIGRSSAISVDCIRGEISFWTGNAGTGGEAYWKHDNVDADRGYTAAQVFEAQSASIKAFGLGFGLAITNRDPSGLYGGPGVTVLCIVLPFWFLTALLALLPARVMWRQSRSAA